MAEFQQSEVGDGQSSLTACEKRPRGLPTGYTPLQIGKRSTKEPKERDSADRQLRRRRLAFAKTDAWSDIEQSALVEFILLHKPGRSWPAEQDCKFWDAAAEYVAMRSKRDVLRSGIIMTVHNLY